MDDRDIQAVLEKYRPAEPPAELQARIEDTIRQSTTSIHQLTNPPFYQLTWPWAAAAVALLLVAVVLHGTATAPTLEAPGPSASQLAEALGGGEAALEMADFIVSSSTTAEPRVTNEAPWSKPQ